VADPNVIDRSAGQKLRQLWQRLVLDARRGDAHPIERRRAGRSAQGASRQPPMGIGEDTLAEETEEPIAAKATPTRASRGKEWLGQRFEKYERLPFADVALAIYRRDRDSAGSVVGSAIAFRLFLFFVPLLLFVVGIAGFVSGFVHAQDVNSTAGVSGTLAAQINSAFQTPNGTRWIATLLGLFGVVTAGRSLSKALVSASVVAWRLPTRPRTSFRTVGAIAGLVFGMALISVLVNRVRESLGLGAANVSFIFAFVVYAIAWLGISM
jgi:hypothetical protein